MHSPRFVNKGLVISMTVVVPLLLFTMFASGINHTAPLAKDARTHTLATTNKVTTANPQLKKLNPADTWNNIHPFQNFDTRVSDLFTTATSYDAVYGAQLNHVQAYRAANPNQLLTYYLPFHRDFGTFENNMAIHSLGYWQTAHPDWVVYKCDRVTPALQYGNPNIPLDFTNSAMVAWQVQTYAIPAREHGYNAIAPDNIDFGNWYHACGIYRNGRWVQLYSGQPQDAQWRAGILNWLTQMHNALQNMSQPIGMIPNLALGGLSPLDPSVLRAVDLSDGILDEGGFTFYGDAYVTNNSWVQHVQLDEYVQSQHKPCYIVEDLPAMNRFNIQWALASYLMTKDHASLIYISLPQGYGLDSWHTEYSARIGSPMNAMHEGQYVYWRDYTNGVSIVNPSSHNGYVVRLKSGVHYVDLYGHPVGPTVYMPVHSGLVLLIQSSTRRR